MKLTHKEWLCLVDEQALAEIRARAPEQAHERFNTRGPLAAYLWRQIELTLTSGVICLDLMSVNEQAANGGYWSGGCGVRQLRLQWPDLDDAEFLRSLVETEQFGVGTQVLKLFDELRENRLVLLDALNLHIGGRSSTPRGKRACLCL